MKGAIYVGRAFTYMCRRMLVVVYTHKSTNTLWPCGLFTININRIERMRSHPFGKQVQYVCLCYKNVFMLHFDVQLYVPYDTISCLQILI